MKKSKTKTTKKLTKKALVTALAFSVGAAAYAAGARDISNDSLLSLKEIGTSSTLIAHGGEGKCGEGKCGEGKCGEGAKARVKGKEGNCGMKKMFGKWFGKKKKDKSAKTATKSSDGKCGEGSCG